MNNRVLSRFLPAFFVGFLFWSWGGVAGWRTLQALGPALNPASVPRAEAAKKSAPAPKTVPSEREKLSISRRLGDAVKEPAKLTPSDVARVGTALGDDAGKMLQLLRDASR
jgi:hypothetical protein